MGSGIRGESFHGMPPRGLAPAGEGVRSSPATAEAGGPGGRIVRAVSIAGSGAAGSRHDGRRRGSQIGRGGAPRRRGLHELAAATQAKLVVVLIFFAAAVAGDQNDPRSAYGN